MASSDDLISSTDVLLAIQDAGLPGIDKDALAQKRYGHVYRLFADGKVRFERDGRLLKVRRGQLPDVAAKLGVVSPTSSTKAAA